MTSCLLLFRVARNRKLLSASAAAMGVVLASIAAGAPAEFRFRPRHEYLATATVDSMRFGSVWLTPETPARCSIVTMTIDSCYCGGLSGVRRAFMHYAWSRDNNGKPVIESCQDCPPVLLSGDRILLHGLAAAAPTGDGSETSFVDAILSVLFFDARDGSRPDSALVEMRTDVHPQADPTGISYEAGLKAVISRHPTGSPMSLAAALSRMMAQCKSCQRAGGHD